MHCTTVRAQTIITPCTNRQVIHIVTVQVTHVCN